MKRKNPSSTSVGTPATDNDDNDAKRVQKPGHGVGGKYDWRDVQSMVFYAVKNNGPNANVAKLIGKVGHPDTPQSRRDDDKWLPVNVRTPPVVVKWPREHNCGNFGQFATQVDETVQFTLDLTLGGLPDDIVAKRPKLPGEQEEFFEHIKKLALDALRQAWKDPKYYAERRRKLMDDKERQNNVKYELGMDSVDRSDPAFEALLEEKAWNRFLDEANMPVRVNKNGETVIYAGCKVFRKPKEGDKPRDQAHLLEQAKKNGDDHAKLMQRMINQGYNYNRLTVVNASNKPIKAPDNYATPLLFRDAVVSVVLQFEVTNGGTGYGVKCVLHPWEPIQRIRKGVEGSSGVSPYEDYGDLGDDDDDSASAKLEPANAEPPSTFGNNADLGKEDDDDDEDDE
jgi:hypothetical protein